MSHSATVLPRTRVLEALAHRSGAGTPFSWGFGPTGEMQEVLRQYCAGLGLDWPRLRDANVRERLARRANHEPGLRSRR
jgi:hypothetical protein